MRKKLTAKDLYEYMILSENTTAKNESNVSEGQFSNFKKEIPLLYPKKKIDERGKIILDKDGHPLEGMAVGTLVNVLSTPSGHAHFCNMRMRGPIIAFLEVDKVVVQIFPQYCMN
jgi:hypothetical protein